MERCKRILLKTTFGGHSPPYLFRPKKEKQKSGEREIIRWETGESDKLPVKFSNANKMADDRSPRRRKRTFSTTSTISTDDYQDASEQIVEDISLEFFYKPRSITALACLFVYLVYSAFTRWGFYLHMSYFSGRAVLSSFSFATYTWISTFLNSKRNYEFLTQFFYVQIKKKLSGIQSQVLVDWVIISRCYGCHGLIYMHSYCTQLA